MVGGEQAQTPAGAGAAWIQSGAPCTKGEAYERQLDPCWKLGGAYGFAWGTSLQGLLKYEVPNLIHDLVLHKAGVTATSGQQDHYVRVGVLMLGRLPLGNFARPHYPDVLCKKGRSLEDSHIVNGRMLFLSKS